MEACQNGHDSVVKVLLELDVISVDIVNAKFGEVFRCCYRCSICFIWLFCFLLDSSYIVDACMQKQ
jgi:hypothetical protein